MRSATCRLRCRRGSCACWRKGEFYRVGGQTPIRVDVRVIAATHQNLQTRVERGLFREDLFHRLNVIRIELPPLRARAEDIPDLLDHYLRFAAQELAVAPKVFATETIAKLAAYSWPGNVRELVNLCRRLAVLAPGREVRIEDLPPELTAAVPSGVCRCRLGAGAGCVGGCPRDDGQTAAPR